MKITPVKIKVRDLVKNYKNDTSTGQVSGYDNKLDIRPAYQREFVYKDKQRDAVINSIQHKFPLNIIYWAVSGKDKYEVIDGQQRIISICSYCNDEYSIDFRFFHNLAQDEKDVILNYELDVYLCDGTDSEKLEWFKIINIAGEKLTDQELRNAVYAGTWLSDAKKKFSARNCPAERLAKDYLSGNPIRQDYLETALNWVSDIANQNIEDYMARHQLDNNANEIWLYFNSVIEWVKSTFPNYRKEMKGVQWGLLYNQYSKASINIAEIEEKIKTLMMDEDVTNKKGIYTYVLSGEEKYLSIRAFTPNMKREAYERQDHRCPYCQDENIDKQWDISEMECDHIKPWHEGGKTISDNCQMLCKAHNRKKSGK